MNIYKVITDYCLDEPFIIKACNFEFDYDAHIIVFYNGASYGHDNVACFPIDKVVGIVLVGKESAELPNEDNN